MTGQDWPRGPGAVSSTPPRPPLACIQAHRDTCQGPVELREPLSPTGVSHPRCARHWQERLVLEAGLRERYPVTPPRDWSPDDAGESWDELD